MGEMLTLFSDSFVAAALLSIAIALIGPLMLINRTGYLAASIAHGSYGGVGIAIYLGISVLAGATAFALALALLLAFLSQRGAKHLEVLIGVLWALGMSIGIIFIDLTPGYHSDLMAYLFGNILLVPKSDLVYMLIVDGLLLLFVWRYYHHLLAMAYDREFAMARGVRVGLLHTLLLVLMALTIVMSIRSIGLILVIALFSVPPFIAERLAKDFRQTIILSGILAFVVMVAGLVVAYTLDVSATAAIIIVASVLFFLSLIKGRS